MRYATDIQLDQVIVHILDPWSTQGVVFSERVLPLDDNQAVIDYFVTHIQNSLQDSIARAGRFVHLNEEATSGLCNGLLDGSLNLVEGSRRLAEHLSTIIARDRRISSGDLAVCFYRAGNQSHVPRYLGLLKIDPSEVFRHRTERDAHGNLYVSFAIEPDVLPTTRERLQKCAFVQPLEPRQDYDMMLLDRQVGPTNVRSVARFFVEDFLGAELALDTRQRTDKLYRSLVSAHYSLRPELSLDQDESLHQAIGSAITTEYINVDAWLSALRLPQSHREQIEQVISQELPDREFEIDTTYAKQLVRKRLFRGDYQLRVEVSEESYNRVIRSGERVDQSGAPSYYQVTIHTERWEEIPR